MKKATYYSGEADAFVKDNVARWMLKKYTRMAHFVLVVGPACGRIAGNLLVPLDTQSTRNNETHIRVCRECAGFEAGYDHATKNREEISGRKP